MPSYGIDRILKLLPHRYPFLLIDKVEDYAEDGSHLVAIKNVTMNEPFFQGHFPGKPIMPGVLHVEAIAQACGLMCLSATTKDATGGATAYDTILTGIEGARFRRMIIPGDTIKGEPVYVPGDTVRGKKRIAINLEQGHKAHNEYEEAASENKGKVAATRKKIEENKQKILQAAGEEKGPGVVVERVAVNLNSEKKKGKGKTAQVAAADFYMALNNLGRSE